MFFTSENAKEMQLRGAKAKVNKRLALEAAMAEADKGDQIAVNGPPRPEFESRTLARVRLQLDKVYEQFMHETDPQKLDRLAAAQSRLSEQERQLSGRPLPGTLRPTVSKPSKAKYQAPEPTPIQGYCGPEQPVQPPQVVASPGPEATSPEQPMA